MLARNKGKDTALSVRNKRKGHSCVSGGNKGKVTSVSVRNKALSAQNPSTKETNTCRVFYKLSKCLKKA